MYPRPVRRRAGARACWVVAALSCALAGMGAAHAQKKKKDGLFDIDWWKPPVRHEHNAAQSYAPRGLNVAPGGAPQGEARVLRMRIYADRDYRGTVIRWQTKMKAQVQRINTVVGAVFNLRFEIDGLREWDRSHAGVALGSALVDELEALDPAKDVDLVIGLVTPLQGVATSAHSIGIAPYLGRHFVLRGMDDEQEFRDFERAFPLISADERQRLYSDRKAHKEVVLFLHEWGHTLGLTHHEERRSIMNPAYDHQQTEFSDYDKRVVSLVVERRAAARDQPFPESADLLPVVTAMPAEEGSEAERTHLLDLLRRRVEHGKRAARDAKDGVDLSPADVDAFNKAVAALNGGRQDEAWKLLAPIIEHTRARKAGGKTWLYIAELASAAGALTAADDAAGRAGASADAQKIVADIESTRHRIALPLDAAKLGVPPEREPAYVAGFYDTARLLFGNDPATARARLGELAAAFPGAPGVDVLSCDLELKAKHAALASKHCEAALAKFKGATRAHYLLALIAFRARREAVGEQHLRQAILLDPTDPVAWKTLAQFYRNTGASKRLAQLASEHQALLSSPLPE
jgi:hypothetical protein